MKIMITFVLSLMLSFNVLAIENEKMQISQISNLTIPQQAQAISALSHEMPTLNGAKQSQEGVQSEVFSEIFVYLVIIMIYSLYWRYFSTY